MKDITSEAELRHRSLAVLAKPRPQPLRDMAPSIREKCPWFFVEGQGCRLVTADGMEFLDLEMRRGPNLLGYRPFELEALSGRASVIPSATLMSRYEIETAERLRSLFPCAERVVFGKNGSDACTGAIRIARALTGHDIVLSSGFHGFHDWCAAEYPWVKAGIPRAYQGLVKVFDLNDFEALERLVREHRRNFAAIIVEPAHRLLPDPGFLEACRQAADENGAVLIFDEVVTAFRLHRGGAQAHYGVTPDLACLGKAMANGEAISAVVGKTEVLSALESTYYSMTFQNDNRVFMVARHCLDILADGHITEIVTQNGNTLQHAFDSAAKRHDLPHRALGFPGRLDLVFFPVGQVGVPEQEAIFAETLIQHGVLPTRSVFACAAMTERDFCQAEAAFQAGMSCIARNHG